MGDEPPGTGDGVPRHGAARPVARRRLPPRFEAVVATIVGALAVVAIVLAAAVLMKSGAEARSAASAAGRYSPAPQGSLGATPPVVVVIGDAVTASAPAALPAADLWTQQLDAAQDIDLVVLADSRSGWADADEPTFAEQAARVPSDAALVVFFGGLQDDALTAKQLAADVGDAVTAVRQQAVDARIEVVAPPTVSGGTSALRSALRSSASQAGVGFTDPVGDGWLPADATADDLDAADEAKLADRMTTLIDRTD